MTIDLAIEAIEKLRPEPGDIIVIRLARTDLDENFQAVMKVLGDRVPDGVAVCVAPPGTGVELIKRALSK